MVDFDDILQYLGEFGPYQKRVYSLLCLPVLATGLHATVIAVFILAIPKHRCAIRGLDNDTYDIQSDYHQRLVNLSIPMEDTKFGKEYSKCQLYDVDVNFTDWSDRKTEQMINRTMDCDKWVFDTSTFTSTATTEFGFVCGDLLRRSHLVMAYMVGKVMLSMVAGVVADKFGRKVSMYMCILALFISGFGTSFLSEYISLAIIRAVYGGSKTGLFLNVFTIGVEIVGPSKRKVTGTIVELIYVVGECVIVVAAYFIRDWRKLQLALTIPVTGLLVLWWLIPESPRWLLAKGKVEKAETIIRKAAKVNKVELPADVFAVQAQPQKSQGQLWQLFTHRTLFWRTLVIYLNWIIISFTYFGLALNSGYLYGNVFVNVFISCVVEFVGYLACVPLLDRTGRKKLQCGSMFFSGLACCCTIFTVLYLPHKHQWVTTVLAMIGKMGISTAFCVVYIFSSELFPTMVRNSAMGTCSMMARLGSLVAPYIADLGNLAEGNLGTALPLIIFGAASITAGLACLTLPETLFQKLPDTIEDGINFGKKKEGGMALMSFK